MNPVISIICLFVVSFIVFFIAYSLEKLDCKRSNSVPKDLVDNPQVLFEDFSSKEEKEDTDDIEII